MPYQKLVGFSADTFEVDILTAYLKQLGSADDDGKMTLNLSKKRAKKYLLFMVSRWEKEARAINILVARYTIGDSMDANLLTPRINNITTA